MSSSNQNGGDAPHNSLRAVYNAIVGVLPRRTEATPGQRKSWLLASYVPDWALTFVLVIAFFSLDAIHGNWRDFSVTDTSLRHPFAVHERIPTWALFIIAFVSPFVLQPVINLLSVRSWWDFHCGSLGLLLSVSLAGVITQFVKVTVGRPRPDVLDRCQPPPGTQDPEFGLSTWQICTNTDMAIMKDGFRSFPSGHSSFSFAGLGFLAFYIAGKVHLFDHKGHVAKAWLSLTPLSAAALVAISRNMDYRHHWQDTLVGSILGLVCAYFSYRQYYPPMTSATCDQPYASRIQSRIENDEDEPVFGLDGYRDDDDQRDVELGNRT